LSRRSVDGLEQDLQITTFAGYLILHQSLNYGYVNNSVIYHATAQIKFYDL